MKPEVVIRAATAADISSITGIYRHHVLNGTASFEIDAPGEAEIKQRWEKVALLGCPWLVAERAGVVVGYAYAGPFHPREAYKFTAEDSIYLKPDASRQGIGRALLERLIVECRTAGFKQIVALIGDSANVGSIRLHERCGFQHSGALKKVGTKFDRWLDVVLMQLEL